MYVRHITNSFLTENNLFSSEKINGSILFREIIAAYNENLALRIHTLWHHTLNTAIQTLLIDCFRGYFLKITAILYCPYDCVCETPPLRSVFNICKILLLC